MAHGGDSHKSSGGGGGGGGGKGTPGMGLFLLPIFLSIVGIGKGIGFVKGAFHRAPIVQTEIQEEEGEVEVVTEGEDTALPTENEQGVLTEENTYVAPPVQKNPTIWMVPKIPKVRADNVDEVNRLSIQKMRALRNTK
ncbi:MAG: hypothetical protein PHS53_01680 [Candidatus Pacebacteria bacterium]|nr:hypothetical protein [Candidatus Paceibacterota bacterium]MDD5356840.1 hypothetical protein [Candidatus Paceibacterota bacterium]